MSFEEDLEELSSAEDFFDYFEMEYDQRVVHVNRLHILQRFHDYITAAGESIPDDDEAKKAVYYRLLKQSHDDFVNSSAQQEKVLKVFKTAEGTSFVGLDQIQS